MNDSGFAVSAWHQIDGLYAATYSPGTGWATPVKVATQSVDDLDMQLGLGVDEQGNALITWKADGGAGFMSSTFQVSTSQWTAPAPVPGTNTPHCVLNQARLALSATGDAILVWGRSNYGLPANGSELQASRWVAGSGTGSGRQSPELLVANSAPPEFAVASNDAGDLEAAWIVSDLSPTPAPEGPFVGTIATRRLNASTGWGPVRTIATNLRRSPGQPMLAINIQGAAVLAWRNSFDVSVSTSTYTVAGGWSAPIDLYSPNILSAGDPTVLQPRMTDDGRALLPWIVADNLLLGQVATARYLPATGWEQGRMLTYTG